jgi:hypothetical protein
MTAYTQISPLNSDEALYGGRSQVHLPDGTPMHVYSNTALTSLFLETMRNGAGGAYYFFTWALPAGLGSAGIGSVVLCSDAVGNIYVQWIDGSANMYVKAFVKGVGNTWTAKANMLVVSGTAHPNHGSCLLWCNTGGGTAAAGHLFTSYYSTSLGYAVYDSLDAGVALAAAGTILVSGPIQAFGGAGGASIPIDASPDGFGALLGIIAGRPSGGSPQVASWQMTPAGVVSLNTVISISIAGFSTTLPQIRVVSYGPGSQQWALFAASSGGGTISECNVTMTTVSAAVVGTPVGGDLYGTVLTNNSWDVFSDPNVPPGRVYVLAFAAADVGGLRLYGITCATQTWDATDTLADDLQNGVGGILAVLSNTTNNEFLVRVVNEPLGPVTDYTAFVENSSAQYTGAVGYVQPSGSGNPPALLTPASGTYRDVTTGTPLSWLFNLADGSAQLQFALRFRVAGAAGYRYWNVLSGVATSTPFWNGGSPGLLQSFTLPVGAMVNGRTYNWSIATLSNRYVFSGFAPDFLLIANAAPVVTVSAPTGSITTTSYPTATWTSILALGIVQTSYRVVYYTAAQYGIGGFTPGVSPSTYDSGVIAGSATSFTPPFALANATYRAYVQITVTGGQTSAFAFSGFTLSGTVPLAPLIAAVVTFDATSSLPTVTITVTGQDALGTAAIIYSSDDNGVTWTPIRLSPIALAGGTHIGVTVDYEAPPGRLYRAVATIGNLVSHTVQTGVGVATTPLDFSLQDVLLGTGVTLQNVTDFEPTSTENVAWFEPIGRSRDLRLSTGIMGYKFVVTAEFYDPVSFAAFETMRNAKKTFILRSPFGPVWYVAFNEVFGYVFDNTNPTTYIASFGFTQMDVP